MSRQYLLSPICGLSIFLCLLVGCRSETAQTAQGFQIHPDFILEMVASEPLVFDPVDMQFDENGRTYVLEMPGYPKRDAQSRLVELVDTNTDGKYDKRIVIDDSLGVSTSFMPYKGGFLTAAPPNLLWISDTDGDGKIDSKKTLMGGFADENLQHNFNGLTYGIDNWIYAANGGNSGRPFFVSRPDSVLELRGGDLKFCLEKEVLKRVGESSGGFKITFDDWGRLFETHNLEHISHLVFEDRYLADVPVSSPHTLMNVSDHEENGTSRIYPIGEQETRVNHPEQSGYFSGACGITHYGGGVFPKAFNNGIFVADCVLNLIHLDVVNDHGSTFKTSRMHEKSEFLASSDRAFRPVNMAVGPDGSLYVLDIHREVIEHPEWIPDEMEAKMDLDAGKDKGRVYRIIPKNNWSPTKIDFDADDSKSLVDALKSQNQWTRTTAQRLLVTGKRKDAVPLLRELAENSESALARLHALWTLEGLNALETPLLKEALKDSKKGVRENAIKIAERRLNQEPELYHDLTEVLKDANPRIRMQAMLALGTLSDSNYDALSDAIAEAAALTLANSENDVWAVKALASTLQRQALSFSKSYLKNRSANLEDSDVDLISILAEKVGRDENLSAVASLLETINGEKLANTIKVVLVEALAEGRKKKPLLKSDFGDNHLVANTLSAMESGNDIGLIRATGNLRRAIGLPVSPKIKKLMQEAAKVVVNPKIPTDERLQQLQLLGQNDFENRNKLLYQLLDNTQPIVLQKEALLQLKEANDKKVGERLLELWPDLGPKARKEATDILLYQSHNHDALLTAMENNEVNLGEFNLDLERRRTLLFWSEKDIQERAQALFSDAGVVKRTEAIAQMRPAIEMNGDIDSGVKIFEAECAQCHRYGDTGKDVGPVLTEVNRKSKESLLHDILDPNSAVDTKYLNHQVKTKDGTILTGLIFRETDTEIGIKMMGGAEKILQKSDIDRLYSLGTSMMFEGLEENISHQEMADLLAFLQQ